MRDRINEYQAKYYAHELQRSYANDHVGKLAGLLFDAQVEPKPHQIDAALFVLQSHYLPGVILADEVGLGKTIEAGLVMSQYWAERKRSVLVISPSSLRQQWKQELFDKFLIPADLLDSSSKGDLLAKVGSRSPTVLICSYEFVQRNAAALTRTWDLIVCDEAHRLRNYWTGKAKVATSVADVIAGASKTVLLTATPLQNRLEELYGLVSVFAPDYFYSLDAFKERYIKNRDLAGGDDLTDRVAEISRRTLRRDAEKYIRFTERLPMTFEFEPSQDELDLYDMVNEYLQRDQLYAFTSSQRHLSALILRKRLASSTYAVGSTLERIAARLAEEANSGVRRDGRGTLIIDDDLTSEEIEEVESAAVDMPDERIGTDVIDGMRAEVRELEQYAELARSIKVNEKAVKLNEALTKGFDRLLEIGAAEKAIIFTDSTKTQEYLAESLTEAGWGEGLVLFNGTNDSAPSRAIYADWLERHRDSDLRTGIAAADRRKALVDYFRDSGRIMIATEAAAEGINLQFCSMVVNYDLPWNPQRIEQRIGRCHRFGQKHNVIVVNFSNKGNLAEQRILQLLTTKFHLFENVFGASDQVLGAIEDGVAFETNIAQILNRCRTAEQIESAFQDLESRFSDEIGAEMESVRTKVFDHLDPNVQDRLKSYDEQSGEVLNKFERLLLAVTRRELAEYASFDDKSRNFVLDRTPAPDIPTGPYYFKSEPTENGHQYRFAGPLAQHVVEQAANSPTPTARLRFSISASERASSAIKELEGASGTLVARLITFQMKANKEDVSESYMLSGALTSTGKWLDDEYVADLLDLTCSDVTAASDLSIDESAYERHLDERKTELEHEVQARNAQYYDQQEELIYRNSLDRKAESEAKIRESQAKEKEHRKLARQAQDPMEQLQHKKKARRWAERADDEYERSRQERREMRDQADEYLDLIEASLKGTQTIDDLFTIEWSVVA